MGSIENLHDPGIPHLADPGWSYDMNVVRTELERAFDNPLDEAERIAVLILRRLYVPGSNEASMVQNFFAIRKTLRDDCSLKARSDGDSNG